LSVPDEGYSMSVPDEGYSMSVPDEGKILNVILTVDIHYVQGQLYQIHSSKKCN
jgi:hypothetical protein